MVMVEVGKRIIKSLNCVWQKYQHSKTDWHTTLVGALSFYKSGEYDLREFPFLNKSFSLKSITMFIYFQDLIGG